MRGRLWRKEFWVPLALVAPALAYVAAISFYPTLDAVYLSFQTPFESNTLTNYKLLHLFGVYPAIDNTIYFTAGALAFQFVLGLGAALLLAQVFRGKSFVSTALILPIGFATVVTGYVFTLILPAGGGGYANSVLHGLSLPTVDWYANNDMVLFSIIVADSWKNTPLITLILLAGLTTIPRNLYEAAAVDGAGPVRRFLFVTIPNLKAFIAIALIIRGISEFNIFALFLIMGTSATPVLTTLAYDLYYTGASIHITMAAASILLGFVMVFVVIVLVLGGGGGGRGRR